MLVLSWSLLGLACLSTAVGSLEISSGSALVLIGSVTSDTAGLFLTSSVLVPGGSSDDSISGCSS